MKTITPLACGLLTALATLINPAHAETPIVVTATRMAQTADDSLASVTIISRDEIERSQARSLGELLRGRAGVNLVSQGGNGKLTSLYLRGTNPGHVALLVDGIRMGSTTAGTVSWEFLPLDEIEKIEIVRGPHSALYGSEAIGGVIQVFTRKGDGTARITAMAGGGRYGARDASAGVSGSHDDIHYAAHIAHRQTDGFDVRQPTVEFGSPVDDPDADGHDNTSASLRIGTRLGGATEIEFHGMHAAGNTEYDTAVPFADEDDFVQQALGLTLRTTPTEHWDLTLAGGRSLDERESLRAGTPGSEVRFNTERVTLSLQNDFALHNEDTLSFGIDYHDDRVDSTTAYTESSRATTAGFLQYQGEIGAHGYLLRVRQLDDEQFGDHTTGNLSWGYQLSDTARISASYGTAYKAPTFNDLYFPGFSNPNLQPETAETAELGADGTAGTLDWSVRAFHTRIDDLIVLSGPPTFLPGNINEAEINGLELMLAGDLHGWSTRLAGTLLQPEDKSTGNDLPRRARRSVRLDLDRDFDRASFGATLLAESSRYDDPANSVRVGGFGIVDLRGSYRLGKQLELRARIDNVTDKDYRTVATYNAAGRSLFVALHYTTGN